MIDKIIGFIGAGNMGSAMIGGIVHSELVTTSQIIASAHSAATLEKLQSTYSIETTLSNETVAERSDILFLAVKPNKFDEVIVYCGSGITACPNSLALTEVGINHKVYTGSFSDWISYDDNKVEVK